MPPGEGPATVRVAAVVPDVADTGSAPRRLPRRGHRRVPSRQRRKATGGPPQLVTSAVLNLAQALEPQSSV